MCEHHESDGGSTNTLEYVIDCKVKLFGRIKADILKFFNYALVLSCCQQKMCFVF